MKKVSILSAFFGLIMVSSVALADDDGRITNFTANIVGSDKDIEFTWDQFPDVANLDNIDAYGVMWRDSLTKIDSDTYTNQEVDISENSLRIRGKDFRNERLYAAVFTRHEVNGNRYLMNGSAPIQIDVSGNGDITVQVHNRTIVDGSSPLETSEGRTIPEVDFGQMVGIGSFPNQFIFSWPSKHELADSDYDKIVFKVSKSSGMSDPILTFEAKSGVKSAKVKGAQPSSQYYVRAHYEKDGVKFGESEVFSFETRAPYTAAEESRRGVLRANGLIRDTAEMDVTIGNDEVTSSTTTTTTSTTSTQSSSSYENAQDLRNRIAQLKSELRSLEAQLRNLEGNSTSLTSVPRGRSSVTSRFSGYSLGGGYTIGG